MDFVILHNRTLILKEKIGCFAINGMDGLENVRDLWYLNISYIM